MKRTKHMPAAARGQMGRARLVMFDVVFAGILFICLWFVGWIGRLAYQNTCIELQQQYIRLEADEVVREIETGIRFGKPISSYYGMEEILERFCEMVPGNLEAAVLAPDGSLLYHSFAGKDKEREYVAGLLSKEYQESLRSVTDGKADGNTAAFGSLESMVWTLSDKEGERQGRIVLIYDVREFSTPGTAIGRNGMAAVLVGMPILMTAYYLLLYTGRIRVKSWDRAIPVAAVMIGVLAQIAILYGNYQKNYETLIYENAEKIAAGVGERAGEFMEKGLPPGQFYRLEEYFAQKASDSAVIYNIRITHSYADTSRLLNRVEEDTVVSEFADGGGVTVLVTVNREFIDGQMKRMTASFLIIFVICFMVSYELVKIMDILKLKYEAEGAKEAEKLRKTEGPEEIPYHMKLLTFVVYTGIYAGMPYAAVLMRTWNASLFGLAAEVSASLPLTAELFGVMIWSAVIPKVLNRVDLRVLAVCSMGILITGNMGCALAGGPLQLLGMRIVTSLGFALFKYLMNSMVAFGAAEGKSLALGFARYNAGVLGGITVGGSIGAVVAEAMGYQFNYYFSAAMILAGLLGSLVLVPWDVLRVRKKRPETGLKVKRVGFTAVLRKKSVWKFLILGDVPLNIGLMYVVAFLPVYMNQTGQSALAVSYAYLINGICGVYIGALAMRLLSKLPLKQSAAAAMLLASGGILVLTVGHNTGLVMLSAGIMGLFDGYGSPNVTNFFTAIPEVKAIDAAQALTLFGVVGSGVQILCPLIYNLTIRTNGGTGRLSVLGLCFAAVAAGILLLVETPREQAEPRNKDREISV